MFFDLNFHKLLESELPKKYFIPTKYRNAQIKKKL